MSPRFYGRTEPGEPADWRERAIVGGRRARFSPVLIFAIGVLVGLFAAAILP